MLKRNIVKAVALVLCLAIFGLSASTLSAAPQKSSGIDFRMLFKKPIQFFMSLFPSLRNINDELSANNPPSKSSSLKIIRPTGTISSIRLSGHD